MNKIILSDYRKRVEFNGVKGVRTFLNNMLNITFENAEQAKNAELDFIREFPKEFEKYKTGISNNSLLITNYKDSLTINLM